MSYSKDQIPEIHKRYFSDNEAYNLFNYYCRFNKQLYFRVFAGESIKSIEIDLLYSEINSIGNNPCKYINTLGLNKLSISLVKHLLSKIGSPKYEGFFSKQIGLTRSLLKIYRPDQVYAGIEYYSEIEPDRGIGIRSMMLLKKQELMFRALDYHKSMVRPTLRF